MDIDPEDQSSAIDAGSHPEPRRSVKRNVGVLLVTQVITWSISLVLIVALPRYLGSEAIGQYRLVSSVWMIAGTFIGLGTSTVITLDVARRQRQGASAVVAPVLIVRSTAFLLVSCIVALFVAVADYDSSVATLFVIAGFGTLATNIGGIAISALQGFENFSLPSLANIVDKALSTTIITAALVFGAGVHTIAAIAVGSAAVHAVLLFLFLRRYVSLRIRASARDAVQMARRGLPFLFGGFAIVAYHEMDTVLMSLLVDDEQIGWYAAADRLTASSLFIPTIVMSALFPTFARLNQQDPSVAESLVGRGFRSLILFSIPIGFGLATISAPLTLLLFGEEFRQSGPVLAVLSIVLMLMFQTILLGNYAVATGHEKFYFTLIFLGVIATIPLDLVLVPWTNRVFENGAIGGALAYIVTESAILIVAVWRFAPHVVNAATAIRLAKCVVAGAAMVIAIWPLRWVVLVAPIAVGAVVYLTVIVLLKTFTDEERRGIAATGNRVRGKVAASLRARSS